MKKHTPEACATTSRYRFTKGYLAARQIKALHAFFSIAPVFNYLAVPSIAIIISISFPVRFTGHI